MVQLESRRIGIFLAIAFGFSWAVALVVYLTGGIVDSRPLVEGSPVTWAFLLLILYMFGPAFGNLGARLFSGEGWRNLQLKPHLKQGWPYWLIAWLATPLLVVAGAMLYFVLNPQMLNRVALDQAALPGLQQSSLPAWLTVAVLIGLSVLIAPVTNAVATFGEEFGWRAYLQPKLLPLGERKMYILTGIIWGVWHWPVIWMGYNYPGYPLAGSVAMVWFTFVFGTFIGWTALRGRSVWPAVIGHAVLNGTANFSVLLLQGEPNPLLGPVPVGVIGNFFFTVAAFIILIRAKEIPDIRTEAD